MVSFHDWVDNRRYAFEKILCKFSSRTGERLDEDLSRSEMIVADGKKDWAYYAGVGLLAASIDALDTKWHSDRCAARVRR